MLGLGNRQLGQPSLALTKNDYTPHHTFPSSSSLLAIVFLNASADVRVVSVDLGSLTDPLYVLHGLKAASAHLSTGHHSLARPAYLYDPSASHFDLDRNLRGELGRFFLIDFYSKPRPVGHLQKSILDGQRQEAVVGIQEEVIVKANLGELDSIFDYHR